MLALALPASASAQQDFLTVFKAYQKAGKIDACKFSAKTLREAKEQVPNDFDQYSPDFEAALDAALAYAKERHAFGKPIADFQAIQLKLADMACRVASSRLLTREAAAAFDAGRRCDLEAGMAKLVATEAALENATEAMRIHGAYGYSKEYDIERLYRDAPLTCIGEGTNEMQRIIIARQLVERNRIQ